jgi:hypothetical protein
LGLSSSAMPAQKAAQNLQLLTEGAVAALKLAPWNFAGTLPMKRSCLLEAMAGAHWTT